MLIGIIAGSIVLIANIILTSYCICTGKCCKKPPKIINIEFQSGSGLNKDIKINDDKTIEDLIKLYFDEINQPELFNDNDIYFQYSEKVIDKNSKELVSSIFQKIKDNDVYVINVVDVRNKKKQKDEETIKITFKSASGMTKDININQNKTIEELIKLFFSEINKPELFNDNDVNFLYSAEVISKNSKELVSEIFKKVLDIDVYVVTIVDLKNKINSK